MNCKYVCVAKCPELDYHNEPHCKCVDPTHVFEDYPDGCPAGNTPRWEPIGGREVTAERYEEMLSVIDGFWKDLQNLGILKKKDTPTLEELLDYIEQVKCEARVEVAEKLKAEAKGIIDDSFVDGIVDALNT